MMDQMPIDPKPLCRCVLCIRDAMRIWLPPSPDEKARTQAR